MKGIKPQGQAAIPHPCGHLHWAISDRHNPLDPEPSCTALFRPQPSTNDGAGQVGGVPHLAFSTLTPAPFILNGAGQSETNQKRCFVSLVTFENKSN